jgi:hypothetical protein
MKIIAGIVLGFALGFLAYALFLGKNGTAYHWRAIEKYNALVSNPANWKPEGTTGFSSVTVPNDIEESLAALVGEGELTHLDLVFPRIPKSREAETAWMKYCQTNKQIVYATGNPSYAGTQTSGVQPLHLNLWFRPPDIAVVQRLVQELEKKYAR